MFQYVPPRIERRDVEAFAHDGAVCVRGLFDSSWVDRMRQAIDRNRIDPRAVPGTLQSGRSGRIPERQVSVDLRSGLPGRGARLTSRRSRLPPHGRFAA